MSTLSSTRVIVSSAGACTRGSRTSAAISSVSVSRSACSRRTLRWLTLPLLGHPLVLTLRLVRGARAVVDLCERQGRRVERNGVLRDRDDLCAAGGHRDAHDIVDQLERLAALVARHGGAELGALPDIELADLGDRD